MAYSYRCTHSRCRARVTLSRPLATYVRSPKGVCLPDTCAVCGVGRLHSSDAEIRRWNRSEGNRDTLCRCALVPAPHRRGCRYAPTKGPRSGGVWYCESYSDPVADPFGVAEFGKSMIGGSEPPF